MQSNDRSRIELTSEGSMHPGQDLVIAGFVALSGTMKAVEQKEQELLTYYSADFLKSVKRLTKQKLSKQLFLLYEEWDITAIYEVTEGGIMSALWYMTRYHETGVTIDLKKIPIFQETIEICEVFDLNPYRLLSEGCFLLAADHGEDLVQRLTEHRIPAITAGKITNGIKRLIINGENRSFLDRPQKDELRKLL